ncbi:hypothetical protein F7725_010854 [Dissostichus mawsoni]|uniref:Uncharacterized protein n=1 Tax=Dissostichus mawsoni TaxID=36200 RepID=A0A7J5Z7Z5_DISMA|nr:hypothetical protein F7725_010854 [Dissostichus mawsoni]
MRNRGFQVFRGSTFSISCSIQPQYPGGSFQLSSSTHNYTQPAVSSVFTCVSLTCLSVSVSDPPPLILRAVVLLLIHLLILQLAIGLYFCCKVGMCSEDCNVGLKRSRKSPLCCHVSAGHQGQRGQEDMELLEVNLAVMSLQATRLELVWVKLGGSLSSRWVRWMRLSAPPGWVSVRRVHGAALLLLLLQEELLQSRGARLQHGAGPDGLRGGETR